MDYEKERSRTRFHYSPPRAYRKHSRPHRRERLESDIPPETREEREQRLEFERKLRKRSQREEDEVFGETKESHRDEEFCKRGRDGRGERKRAASPPGGQTTRGRATQPQTPTSPVQTVARQRVSPRLSTLPPRPPPPCCPSIIRIFSPHLLDTCMNEEIDK